MLFNDALKVASLSLQLGEEFVWREKQIDCLRAVFEQKDLFAILPTGFGKSLIYQATPFLLYAKNKLNEELHLQCDKIILVITPLNSIMMDQCRELNQKGISACYLNFESTHGITYTNSVENDSTQVDIDDIQKFNIIYAHPEALLCSNGRKLLNHIRTNVCAIAIDEAHMVLEWGFDFRKEFTKIGSDLLPLFASTPVMVFTATATIATQEILIKQLNLCNPVIITMNPDRTNIKLRVLQRPASEKTNDHLDSILTEIAKDLKEKKSEYPLTIVYTDTSVIAYSYWFLENTLGQHQYVGEEKPENRLFAQYHKEYTSDMKEFIVSQLCSDHSKIRIIFATIGLGMGLNAKSIRHVIHYKPPTSLEKYFQEIGRVGRDGEPASATLYFNNTDIRSNRPGMTSEMGEYCKQTSQCRRSFLLNYFGHGIINKPNSCCDLCDQESK